MFDAHFHSPGEQIVTSFVLLALLGVFAYPIFRDGPGFFFWVLLIAMLAIVLPIIMDFYFMILKLITKSKKRRDKGES